MTPKHFIFTLSLIFIFHISNAQTDTSTSKLMSMIGTTAPDFTLPNLQWQDITLSKQQKKAVLIDFWASWCRYCRQFNDELSGLYEVYNKDGFEIISVSLDTDYYKWKRAISDDNLTWINVNDRNGLESKVAEKYNIIHTPTTFLLNEKGEIVSIDLEGEELENKIKDLLK